MGKLDYFTLLIGVITPLITEAGAHLVGYCHHDQSGLGSSKKETTGMSMVLRKWIITPL